MRPLLRPIVAVLVFILCQQVSQAMARVVRDGKTAPSNPAVEAGGTRPAPQSPPQVPYSLIGALASEEAAQSAAWVAANWFSRRCGSRHHRIGRL
jgi:hypothetical protein